MTVQNAINTQSLPNQSTKIVEEKPKKKKGIFIALIILIILIIAGVFFYPKIKEYLSKTEPSAVDKIYDTTSFLLIDNNKKAAIFNLDGKQLTDFLYTEASAKFVNNTAYVKNENNEYAIINSNGKEIIKFGKYDKITDIGAAYIAKTPDNKYFLYNRAGNLVKELVSEPTPFGLNVNSDRTVSYLSIGIFDNNKFTIINYAGEELLSFPFVENEHTVYEGEKISPKTNLYDDKYLTVYYNQHNYILNLLTKEVIVDFDSPYYFKVAAVNEDKNEIFLTSVSQQIGWDYEDNNDEIFEYKLIRNKEVIYSNTHEEEITEAYYNNGIIEIHDFINYYILTETGDKILLSGEQYILGYSDYTNYIKRGTNDNKELYVNNELKQVFDCEKIERNNTYKNRYAIHGIYVLKECEGYADKDSFFDTKDIIIKSDGTLLNDKAYEYVSEFDANGYLTVSEDGKVGYLIDSTGKKISKDFYAESSYGYEYYEDDISLLRYNDKEKMFYIGKNQDETETLFDLNGNEYVTANSIEQTYNTISEDIFALLEYDDYYTVYNVTKQKEILKTKEEPDCESEYIEIDYDNKREYYSYSTGKLFYTLEL